MAFRSYALFVNVKNMVSEVVYRTIEPFLPEKTSPKEVVLRCAVPFG
jgi:hypothetical protein